VRDRRGRATVFDPLGVESQTLFAIAECEVRTGTRNPRRIDVRYGTYAPAQPVTAIPLREWLPWAIFAGLILLLAIYFVGAEQGATSLFSGMYVHEFVHDARHLLGFPCH
jgi:hypothetical protein